MKKNTRGKNPLDEALMWRTFAVELSSGLPILQSIRLLSDAFAGYKTELDGVHDAIKEGECIYTPLTRYKKSFHPLVPGMVQVGEETGALPEMLFKASDIVETEFELRVRNAIRLCSYEQMNEILFFDYLATTTDAGLPLLRGLRIVSEASEKPYNSIARDIAEKVEGGFTLSEAMASQEGVFSPIQLGLVKAGEAGGVLEVILTRISDHLKYTYQLENRYGAALDDALNPVDQKE